MQKFINPIQLKKQIQSKIQSAEPDLSDLTSKAQAVDKFTKHLFSKAHKCLFVYLIIICSLIGIPMLCLNYMSSLGNPQNLSSVSPPTNTILLMLLNGSTFSTIYYSQTNPYIQLFILMTLLIFSLALLLLAETWLKYIPKLYQERVVRIESYSLQITVRDKIKRKDIKEFTEYLDTYIIKCIMWKISLIQNTQNKSLQERFLFNLLKEISKKPTAIQDAIPLPFRTKDVPTELLDMREQSSHIIIAVFTYPQVAQVALQWWQNQQNAQTVKAHILDVSVAPSPRNLLFDKFQNKGDYKNKRASTDRYIFVALLWEFLFFVLFCGTVYLGSMPGMIFPTQFKTSYEFMFRMGMVGAQGVILFLHVRLYHETFIQGFLLKSFRSIFTFEEEAKRAITWSILLLVWDLFILPTCAHLFVDLAGFGFIFDNFKLILQDAIYSQYGISNVLVCYCAIKHVLIPLLKGTYRLIIKFLSKCRICSERLFEEEYTTAYTSLFLQFIMLFCWSIYSSPLVACLAMIGLLFKLQEFCNVKHFKQNCLIAVCVYLKKLIFLIKYFLIVAGGIFMTSLLNGYILAIKSEFMNPLIIGIIGALLILVLSIFMDKIEPNAFQRPVYLFFDSLPEKIESKILYNPQQQQKYENTKLVMDEMTKAIIQKVYPNQQIFYNYYDQLKENKRLFTSQLPELNRQDSVKKINQEMNTMSRSLEQSLKNKLLEKPPNPFEIGASTKEQQGQYSGIIYEDKVVMAPRKFKNVFIPLLQLPYGKRHSQPQGQNKLTNNKTLGQQLQRHNTAGEPRKKEKPKRMYEQYNMAGNETNSWGDVMIHGNDIQQQEQQKNKKSKENEKTKKLTQEKPIQQRENEQQDLADELLKRKVKFTDLFDSDQESIKNLVKKKIKQSIPKLI